MNVINPIIYLSNRVGIPRIQSNSVTVNGTTNVQYTFDSGLLFNKNYSGLILIRLNQTVPTGTTTTLPVVFTSTLGDTVSVTTYAGADVTVANLSGLGIYLFYYDGPTSTLQALTGIIS